MKEVNACGIQSVDGSSPAIAIEMGRAKFFSGLHFLARAGLGTAFSDRGSVRATEFGLFSSNL